MTHQHPEACCPECHTRAFFLPTCTGPVPELVDQFFNEVYGSRNAALDPYWYLDYDDACIFVSSLQEEFKAWALSKNAHIDEELWDLMGHHESKVSQYAISQHEAWLSLA